ncbi:MAG: hypothetical protein CMO55_17920 [Verrucomicrobiales bacterium]|nr:hypothetical protein [Verrucomicrobiales bacterium]
MPVPASVPTVGFPRHLKESGDQPGGRELVELTNRFAEQLMRMLVEIGIAQPELLLQIEDQRSLLFGALKRTIGVVTAVASPIVISVRRVAGMAIAVRAGTLGIGDAVVLIRDESDVFRQLRVDARLEDMIQLLDLGRNCVQVVKLDLDGGRCGNRRKIRKPAFLGELGLQGDGHDSVWLNLMTGGARS